MQPEQLNRSDAIKRTMKWFADSGLGARGLDTPAEFMVWLEMNGGDLSMTNGHHHIPQAGHPRQVRMLTATTMRSRMFMPMSEAAAIILALRA